MRFSPIRLPLRVPDGKILDGLIDSSYDDAASVGSLHLWATVGCAITHDAAICGADYDLKADYRLGHECR